MNLYILRHGRTAWNDAGRLQGRTDIPLNEEGRRSARAAGEELEPVPFSAAFTSPLLRAKETAELILRGRSTPLRCDEDLIELCYGAAEGMTEIGESPIFDLFSRASSYVPPEGGESYDALLCRCRNFLQREILPFEGRYENVLIVSHGGTLRGLFDVMLGAQSDALYRGRVQKNCGVNIVALTDGRFSLLRFDAKYDAMQ